MRLLALELSEVDEELSFVAAVAAVGAVTIIMAARALAVDPEHVIAQIRAVMAPG
jgi:hypothetical protein